MSFSLQISSFFTPTTARNEPKKVMHLIPRFEMLWFLKGSRCVI